MNELFSLKEKVAIVTGGADYLGFAMTEVLVEYGAIVYIASRNEEYNKQKALELEKRYRSKVHSVKMDVTCTDSVKEAITDIIIGREGKIDILINNSNAGKTAELLTGL